MSTTNKDFTLTPKEVKIVKRNLVYFFKSDKEEVDKIYKRIKEYLQPKPKIKTWEDIKDNENDFYKNYINFHKTDNGNYCLDADGSHDIKVILKSIATLKIAKLIELGYGGMVTEEEWKNTNIEKYCVYVRVGKIKIHYEGFNTYDRRFVAFHTPEQRDKFISYPENRKLIKQYHMI